MIYYRLRFLPGSPMGESHTPACRQQLRQVLGTASYQQPWWAVAEALTPLGDSSQERLRWLCCDGEFHNQHSYSSLLHSGWKPEPLTAHAALAALRFLTLTAATPAAPADKEQYPHE